MRISSSGDTLSRTTLSKIVSTFVAFMLCVGLMPAFAASASAEEGADDAVSMAGTATLTIVYGVDSFSNTPNVLANVTYGFAADATVADLLDTAVNAGDINAYELNQYGYLASITGADGTVMATSDDMALYWSNFEDGAYYSGSDTLTTEKLQDGVSYQFAWNSYPTAVPPTDWSTCGTPTTSTQVAGAGSAVGHATCTIVHGVDSFSNTPNVLANVTYGFGADATVADLLDAAVAAGDINAYELNQYGYLASITGVDGTVMATSDDMALYWSDFEDGAYYSGSDTLATEKLKDGVSYQFAWNSYPTAVPPTDWSTCGVATDKAGNGFSDVKSDLERAGLDAAQVWYVGEGWLDYAVSNKLMTGYTDGSNDFGPYDSITRAQVATILYRNAVAADSTLEAEYGSTTDTANYATTTVFTDEAPSQYYTAAVNWANEAKVITGYTDEQRAGTFCPDSAVSREELCAMIARYANANGKDTLGDKDYSAIQGMDEVSTWAQDEGCVDWCASWGIVGGVEQSDGSFVMNPQDTTWRASAAKMITVLLRDVIGA